MSVCDSGDPSSISEGGSLKFFWVCFSHRVLQIDSSRVSKEDNIPNKHNESQHDTGGQRCRYDLRWKNPGYMLSLEMLFYSF